MARPVSVYLEVGSKRIFAGALEWPGWCRSGKTEDEALEALVAYAARYKKAVPQSMKFDAPRDDAELEVEERLKGGSGTDFGVPGEAPEADDAPLSPSKLQRHQDLLKASWAAFDGALKAAEGVELTKGPRGGGRDQDKMLGHVLDAEKAYLAMLGSRSPKGPFDDVMAEMRAVRATAQEVLAARASGKPIPDPRNTRKPWLPRYFVRRSAWHALDHAWELEDRSAGTRTSGKTDREGPMQVKELGHVVLYVRDLERSRRFYRDVLGWREIIGMGGMAAMYSSGRTHHELLLLEVGADASPPPPGRRTGLYHFGLKVGESDDELREAVETLRREGVPIIGMTDHTVTHSVYIADPDGNEIELYIDVQPEIWRENPEAIVAEPRPLRL